MSHMSLEFSLSSTELLTTLFVYLKTEFYDINRKCVAYGMKLPGYLWFICMFIKHKHKEASNK